VNELATVEIEDVRGVPVAHIAGEVDASNAANVQRQMIAAVANAGAGLVVDLTRTGYVDSAGIRILFDTGERMQIRGMQMRLVITGGSFLADVLETVRIKERFPVHEELGPAVAGIIDAQLHSAPASE